MEYTTLKSTGLTVSRLCLGTMTFGDQADFDESRRILDACIDNGVNFIDTADIYTFGSSEKFLGELLKGRRDELVLATKVCGPSFKGKNGSGISRKHVMEACDKSLRSLGTDYIDIYYLHFPDGKTPAEEIVMTMDSLIRAGKIRYYGVSNFPAWQICDLVNVARRCGCAAPVVTQSPYNLLTRGIEDELMPFENAYNFGMTCFNPLAGGLLTGKHERNNPEKGSRFDREKGYRLRYFNNLNFDAMDILGAVASDNGMTLTELSLRWLLSHKEVDAVICGASKASQIEQNLAYFDGKRLDADTMKRCDEAWELLRGRYFNYHR